MPRRNFGPTPRDRSYSHELATDELPDRVTVDLDDKDPNNITVVEVEDTPEEDRGHNDTDPATWADANGQDPKTGSPRTEKRIGRLKAETETQRRLREAAERERDAALDLARGQATELADLRKRLDSGSTALAASMKSDREGRVADATRRLEAAHADGDAPAIAKATADLSLANAELVQIAARTPPAPRTEQPQQQQPPVQQPQQRPPDIAPNVAAWISHNASWFNRDKTKTDFAMSVHRAITGRGVRPESDEYTKELDKALKAVYPDHQPYSGSRPENGNEGGDDPRPRRTNAVAEGSRETNRQPNPRTVELTSSQLAIARQLGLTPQQYAASLLKYNANNRIGAR